MLNLDAEYAYWRAMLAPRGAPHTLTDRLEQLRPAWMAYAACRGVGVDLFFPGRGESTRSARAYCARCAVVDECADYAAANHEVGVWGRRPT